MTIPKITPTQLTEIAQRYLPSAQIKLKAFNPDYESWWLSITAPNVQLEFVWGPLSGFGVTNLAVDRDLYDYSATPYDVRLDSLEEAEAYLANFVTE